jgi:hypothetical protein
LYNLWAFTIEFTESNTFSFDLTISSIDEGKFRWSIIKGWTPSCFDSFDENNAKLLCFGDASPNSQVFQAFTGTSDNGNAIDAVVAGRAEDNALAVEFVLARNAEPFPARTGGY